MNRINRRLKIQLLLVVMLAACGQRGPLFLPQPEPQPIPVPAGSDQTESDEARAGDTEDESEKTPGT